MTFKVIWIIELFTVLHVSQDHPFPYLQKNVTFALLIVTWYHYIGFINREIFSTLNLSFCQHFDDSGYWIHATAFPSRNEM